MKKLGYDQALVAGAAICILLHPISSFSAGSPATENVDVPLAGFMGPLPGTTYVYHFFRNGALVEGQERLLKGISREDAFRIRLRVVARLPDGLAPVPLESAAEDVLQLSDGSLDLIDAKGRVFALLSEPLKVGQTWARATMEWRPPSTRLPESSGSRGTESDAKSGTWTPLAGTCRIERLDKAIVFGKERIIVVVSTSLKLTDGITETSTEEWASGLGMVRALKSAKDAGGRDLEVVEQRLVQILKPSSRFRGEGATTLDRAR
jgi:hypothetical protein